MQHHTYRPWVLAVLLLLAGTAHGHDFWLAPDSYRVAPEAHVDIELLIGHKDEVEPWKLRWKRVVALRSYSNHAVIDHQAAIHTTTDDEPGGALIQYPSPGTHVLGFESHHSSIELEAEKFNKYIRKEGLTPAIEARQAAGTNDQPGAEIYSRRAKALIQVGNTYTDQVTEPIGHTLEIVPDKNPYTIKGANEMGFRIYYHAEPLAGAKVRLNRLDKNPVSSQQVQRSDAKGRVEFKVPEQGAWKVNVIWTHEIDDPRADFETIFCSLSFAR